MDHVNTQLPYAMTVGAVAVAFGEIPTAFGLPYWVAWVAGAVVLWAILRWVGARSES
jgi:Na+/H+ antiporter NhaC